MLALHELILYPVLAIILSTLLHGWLSAAALKPRKRLPPSPNKLPIIGNLHQLGKFPHRSLQSLSHRYGPLMLLHLGRVPVLVASSAAAAREITKEQDLIFSNRPKLSSPDRLIYCSKDVAFAPHGDYWRQMRSIFVLRLLSNKRVQSYRRVREEETSLMVEKIRKSAAAAAVVNLSDALESLTSNVICRVALGRKYGEERFFAEFVQLLGISPVGDYVPWLGWTNWFNGLDARRGRVAKRIDKFLERVVREHREMRVEVGDDAAAADMDFVDILLEFQRQNQGSSPVDDDVIKALILDAFSAGTDTTSNALDWTMVELMRNPSAMKRLQNEVREVAARNEGEIGEEDLAKMSYLKAVIKENLRLHPPAPLLVPRESTRDTKVLGYDVAAGTRVMINVWMIGRDPSLWENPKEFRPERFLGTSIDFKGLHFKLLPFGAGRRGCPGIAFATAVYELALAKLVCGFEFGLPNGGRGEDLDMTEESGITVRRKFPLLVVITPRV
ncbi:cytochrome P450 71A6-like [Salvia miltiorrhiza]|uniref:cytochrome P450 71A6-like n=1 Tax=Salvia miltiorrhiza TaxID=226208 RepID=UPI0025ACBFF0|nr:cytochrome P450 71A6-like [Salvia miltiorrhiza]